MDRTSRKKPKLTNAERHKRFVETSLKVGASDRLEDFDNAFDKVTHPSKPTERTKASGTSEP